MSQYPNVRARLQLTLLHPSLPVRRSDMVIWLKDTRFRVRDEAGRHVHLCDALQFRFGGPLHHV